MLDGDLKVRDIRDGDRDGLLDLWSETWSATYGPLIGTDAVDDMLGSLKDSALAEMLPPEDEERAGVAVLGGRIVGSAIMAERGSEASLWGMYIRPAHQRRGIGTALLRHTAQRLVRATSVEVQVLDSSAWALAFYQSHGFEDRRRQPMPLGPGCPPVPGRVMRVSLDALRRRFRSVDRTDDGGESSLRSFHDVRRQPRR